MYARDTFSGPLASTEIGSLQWSYRAGSFATQDGRLSSGDTTGFTPADCWVKPARPVTGIAVAVHSVGAQDHAGILFRRADTTNQAFVYYARASTHVLAKRTGSDSFTVIPPTATAPSFKAGEILTVEQSGDRIICAVNGVVTHDITDATYNTQTGVGVETRMATAANPAVWDDFTLYTD